MIINNFIKEEGEKMQTESKLGMKVAFITNSRGLGKHGEVRDDRRLVYGHDPNIHWQNVNFEPPAVYPWQKVSLDYDNFSVEGHIIVIGSSAIDIRGDNKVGVRKAKQQLKGAVNAAKKAGCQVVCFGAATKRLAENLFKQGEFPSGVVYTHGDTLTVGYAVKEFEEIALKCNLDLCNPTTRILIVGAYGIIGSAITEYLTNKYDCQFTLVGPNPVKLDLLGKDLRQEVELLDNIEKVKGRVHGVITATNSPLAIIHEKHLYSWGAPILISDISQPGSISKAVYEIAKSRILAWESCILENPRIFYQFHYGMGLNINGLKGKLKAVLHVPSKRVFACLAEALILGMASLLDLEIIREKDFISRVDLSNLESVVGLAQKYGFTSRPLEIYGKRQTKKIQAIATSFQIEEDKKRNKAFVVPQSAFSSCSSGFYK